MVLVGMLWCCLVTPPSWRRSNRRAGWKPALREGLHPGPVLQPSLLGIFLNVATDFQQRRFVANEVIKILALPKTAGTSQKFIRLVGRIGFPGMKNGSYRMSSLSRKY